MAADPMQPYPPELVVPLSDPASGLAGAIVLHSTRLGPAAGGCRFWRYATIEQATRDALRLAEGMTYKNALVGLPFGGGKAVLNRPASAFDRTTLFRAFGRAVAALEGRYVTAEDVGTTVEDMVNVAIETRFVAGLPSRPGASGGDPSPWTALGVFQAMEVAVERRLKARIGDLTVAVQGLGNVGFALCDLLHRAGARLVVAEPRRDVAERAMRQFGATVVELDAIIDCPADVFAPCALGGVLDSNSAQRLQAKVVCGAANNQLAASAIGMMLAARDILYAPDYLVNAGGIINVAAERIGWDEDEVRRRVGQIAVRLVQVLDMAARNGMPPNAAADWLARSIVAGRGSTTALAA